MWPLQQDEQFGIFGLFQFVRGSKYSELLACNLAGHLRSPARLMYSCRLLHLRRDIYLLHQLYVISIESLMTIMMADKTHLTAKHD